VGHNHDEEDGMMFERYPTESELEQIKNFDVRNIEDYRSFMELIESLWQYADIGYFTRNGDTYELSTGGWSGNEDIMGAMMENSFFWLFYWDKSERGGHYVFSPLNAKIGE
jgi:hypothetical protein